MHQPVGEPTLSGPASASGELYAKLTIAAGVFFVVLELSYFVMAGPHLSGALPLDDFGATIGRDFLNSWMGGRSAFSGGPAPWFDFQAYNAALEQITGHLDFPDMYWSYPPHLILFIWPLGLLPYLPAYALFVWTFWRRRDPVLSLALFVTATFLFSPWMLNYDMVVFGFVVALLRERTDNTIADDRVAITVWILPVVMRLFGAAHIPIAMIVLPAFAGRLIWRLSRGEARQSIGADVSAEASSAGATALAAH